MSRWVLLRHDLADGSWHFDWMIERAGGASGAGFGAGLAGGPGGLVTFRTMHDPTDRMVHEFPAERLQDHRAAYLEYEGEVSGGRGRVTRVTGGEALIVRDDSGGIEIQIVTPIVRGWAGEAWSADGYVFRLIG